MAYRCRTGPRSARPSELRRWTRSLRPGSEAGCGPAGCRATRIAASWDQPCHEKASRRAKAVVWVRQVIQATTGRPYRLCYSGPTAATSPLSTCSTARPGSPGTSGTTGRVLLPAVRASPRRVASAVDLRVDGVVLVLGAARTPRPVDLDHPGRARLGDIRLDRSVLQPRPTPLRHRLPDPGRARGPSQRRTHRGMINQPQLSGKPGQAPITFRIGSHTCGWLCGDWSDVDAANRGYCDDGRSGQVRARLTTAGFDQAAPVSHSSPGHRCSGRVPAT